MRSLRTRLALSAFVIVLAAVALVALGVTNALDNRLRDEALSALMRSAEMHSRGIDAAVDRGDSAGRIDTLVRDASDEATARVTLLGLYTNPGEQRTWPKSDSTRE